MARPVAQPRSAPTRRQSETPKSRAAESIKSVLEQRCDIKAVAFTFVWLDDQGKTGLYESHPLDAQAPDVSNVTREDVQQRLRAACLRSSKGTSVLGKKRLDVTPDNSDCLPKRRRHSPEDAGDHCVIGRQQCMQETTLYPISDKNTVAQYMKAICNRLYQCTSKFICKDLIQEVQPQKQKTYPYLTKKRNGVKPDRSSVMPFWPSLDECRYMEPDRLWSLERTLLKVSIIRWPHKDPEGFAKFVAQGRLRGFTSWIDMLEDATSDSCRKSFQANKPGCEEVIKAQEAHLAELFRVARLERDYRGGGVDPDTLVYVDNHEKKHDSRRSDAPSPDFVTEQGKQGSPQRTTRDDLTGFTTTAMDKPQLCYQSHRHTSGCDVSSNEPSVGDQPCYHDSYDDAAGERALVDSALSDCGPLTTAMGNTHLARCGSVTFEKTLGNADPLSHDWLDHFRQRQALPRTVAIDFSGSPQHQENNVLESRWITASQQLHTVEEHPPQFSRPRKRSVKRFQGFGPLNEYHQRQMQSMSSTVNFAPRLADQQRCAACSSSLPTSEEWQGETQQEQINLPCGSGVGQDACKNSSPGCSTSRTMSLYSTVSPPFTPFTIQEAAILPSRDWRDNAPAPSTPFLPSDPDRFAMTATYDPATMSAAHAESTERSLAAPASVILPLQYLAYDLPNQSGGSTSPSWPMVTQTSVTQPSSYAAVPELQGVSGPSPAIFEDQWQSNNGFPMTGWSYLQGLRLGAAPGHW